MFLARFGLHRDHARRRLSELRVVVLRRVLAFPNGFQVRVDDDDPEERVPVLRAVELIAGAAEVRPFTWVCVDPCGFSAAACCHPSCCVPGVSRMNLVRLRSNMGALVSWRASNTVATSARSVLSSGDPPVTSIVSVTGPSSSLKSTGVTASTLTTTFGTTAVLQLAISAFTSYVPGISRSWPRAPTHW